MPDHSESCQRVGSRFDCRDAVSGSDSEDSEPDTALKGSAVPLDSEDSDTALKGSAAPFTASPKTHRAPCPAAARHEMSFPATGLHLHAGAVDPGPDLLLVRAGQAEQGRRPARSVAQERGRGPVAEEEAAGGGGGGKAGRVSGRAGADGHDCEREAEEGRQLEDVLGVALGRAAASHDG